MADKLLIRAFNVEVGDCFYVRIPKARVLDGDRDDFHILIDCGTKGSGSLLRTAIERLAEELPAAETAGRKRLDLLVVTHEHQDHIKGFDPDDFKDIEVEHVWLTAAMDPDHEQADNTLRLNRFAVNAMQEIERQGLALSPELHDLMSLFSIDNEGAMTALRVELPKSGEPDYVEAGMTAEKLGLPIDGATIKVLAPEPNIDKFYLGDEDARINGLDKGMTSFGKVSKPDSEPTNISGSDFRGLQSRMMSNAFAFAELASRIKNNTSVVLLIEWAKRRLLFVGDAEWEHDFEVGKQNGSWNVMWHERHDDLAKPVDFLKVGHHGSTNSTPWSEGRADNVEPTEILDTILPVPRGNSKPTAKALVSTKRKNYKTIPRSELLAEIGRRVSNTKNYKTALNRAGQDPTQLRHYEELEKEWISKPQPQRTDLEMLIKPDPPWVDVTIEEGS